MQHVRVFRVSYSTEFGQVGLAFCLCCLHIPYFSCNTTHPSICKYTISGAQTANTHTTASIYILMNSDNLTHFNIKGLTSRYLRNKTVRYRHAVMTRQFLLNTRSSCCPLTQCIMIYSSIHKCVNTSSKCRPSSSTHSSNVTFLNM
jgi:hypothetical protein